MSNNPTTLKQIRYRLETVTIRCLAALLRLLPYGGVDALGRIVGLIGFTLAKTQRRIASANLDLAFGDQKSTREKREIARAAFQNSAATLLKGFWGPRMTRERLGELMEADPAVIERLRKKYEEGHGLLFLTMHYGDWEILGLAMALHGMPATVVTQASRNPFLDNYLNQCRASSGNRMLPHRGAAGQLLRLLRRGGVVAMLIDLNTRPSGGGMWLDFFGLPVLGAGAIGAIALRTGASILFATAHPLGGGRVRLELEEVSPPKRTSRDDSAIRELNQDLLRRCESVIRRDPRHWLWMYKRWKYQPSPDIQGYPFYTTKALTDIR